MISITSGQLDAWLAALLFPLARVLGLIGAAPLFSNQAVPVRIRLGAGVAMALAVIPALPPMPAIGAGSGLGIAILVQQMFIGVAIGFVMRLVFTAVDVMGELVGLQMGLSFATFFDPAAGGQTSVLAEFLGVMATLIFVALNGHLLLVSALVQSFDWLPVATTPTAAAGWGFIARHGATVFATGLLLALPMVAALLITNIAMGVLTRAAPQLNLFAIGFPITLSVGFAVLLLALNLFAPVLGSFYERGFESIAEVLRAFS